jgi:rhamnogalacturonan endolyase
MLGGFSETATAQPAYNFKQLQLEALDRGVVAVRTSTDSVMVSWRYLREDPETVEFALYRDDQLLTEHYTLTNYIDACPAGQAALYRVVATSPRGKVQKRLAEGSWQLAADAPVGYIEIALDKPQGGKVPVRDAAFDKHNPESWVRRAPRDTSSFGRRRMPPPPRFDDGTYTYSVGDGSIGDVDGDGAYELIVKWDPSNAHDNSHAGYTGPVLLDCYKLDGRRLWRINLGRNIRAGAHYTQFMVYDLDGDGKAEVVMKTADGTVDGRGNVLGDSTADYRNSGGYILDGAEYLTVFSGATGEALYTTDYIPARGDMRTWGDNYGNRCDRYLACVAYLDGRRPSVVMCRGYYTRTVLAAWDWDGHKLKQRWVFDTEGTQWKDYAGQGNHNLRVGDVDGDGKDEIIYGSMAVDHDGTGLHNARTGHGDAMHMTAFIPDDPGLQVWDCHENKRDGSTLRDARSGKILFQIPSGDDVGRCMAADIDPTNPGVEMWSLDSHGIRNYRGEVVNASPKHLSYNMAVWWDGDLLRELLDGNRVSKYDWTTGECLPMAVFDGCRSCNGTKSTPVVQCDLLGDWREEVVMRTTDDNALRIYVTPFRTDYRFWSFLQDPIYRISIATENVAYNQPTQPGFYFGPDLKPGSKFRGTVIK